LIAAEELALVGLPAGIEPPKHWIHAKPDVAKALGMGKPLDDSRFFIDGPLMLSSNSRNFGAIFLGLLGHVTFSQGVGVPRLHRPLINLVGPPRTFAANLQSGLNDDIEEMMQMGRGDISVLDLMYSNVDVTEVILPPDLATAAYLTRRILKRSPMPGTPFENVTKPGVYVLSLGFGAKLREPSMKEHAKWMREVVSHSPMQLQPAYLFGNDAVNIAIHVSALQNFRRFTARFMAVPWSRLINAAVASLKRSCTRGGDDSPGRKIAVHFFSEEEDSHPPLEFVSMEQWVANVSGGVTNCMNADEMSPDETELVPSRNWICSFHHHKFLFDKPMDALLHLSKADVLILTSTEFSRVAAALSSKIVITSGVGSRYSEGCLLYEVKGNETLGHIDEESFLRGLSEIQYCRKA